MVDEPPSKKVCSVVVTHNGQQWIQNCLNSLLQSEYATEIVVVDNCSRDDTVHCVRGFPRVHLIALAENFGFGRANNLGIGKALADGADYIFLLNQDAEVDPDTLGQLISAHERDKSFGIISPIHLDTEGSHFDAAFFNYLRRDAFCLFEDLYFDRVSRLYSVEFVNAAAWILSRTFLETVGGFDPIFFMYAEDNDLCDRAHLHGFKVGVAPMSAIRHHREGKAIVRSSHYAARFRRTVKDVRHPLLHNFVRLWYSAALGALKCWKAGDLLGLIKLLMAMVGLLFDLPTLIQSRATSKRKGSHWLQDTKGVNR
jgi:GT2 family glycosyltransferase